jgi:hypothetical protein
VRERSGKYAGASVSDRLIRDGLSLAPPERLHSASTVLPQKMPINASKTSSAASRLAGRCTNSAFGTNGHVDAVAGCPLLRDERTQLGHGLSQLMMTSMVLKHRWCLSNSSGNILSSSRPPSCSHSSVSCSRRKARRRFALTGSSLTVTGKTRRCRSDPP